MIGIIDSGIGGKGIEREIKKIMTDVKIDYFADTKNFPYGTKKVSDLHKILSHNITHLIKQGATIIVLACNSATVSSVDYLRRKFNIPIIGTEPAIKPACSITKTKKIAIFSTPITADSMDYLIKKYGRGITVYKIPFKDLAYLIEAHDKPMYTSRVYNIWSKYGNKNIDTIVLGCTHYTLIRDEIQKIVGRDIKLVDSNAAVAQQVKKIYNTIRTD